MVSEAIERARRVQNNNSLQISIEKFHKRIIEANGGIYNGNEKDDFVNLTLDKILYSPKKVLTG